MTVNKINAEAAEAAQAVADELKESESFSFADIIAGVAYPEGNVKVYLNGKAAQEFSALLEEEQDVLDDEARLKDQFSDHATGVPEEHSVEPRLKEIAAQKEELLKQVLDSALTFYMRGIAPKVLELITEKARRQFPTKGKGPEEVYELNIQAEDFVESNMISSSIVRVENAKGQVDKSAWTPEKVLQLKEVLFRTEYDKIDGLAGKLYGGKALADAQRSADFLQNS